ncbi:MAG: DUF1016 N-terminal domain-containing protein [Thermoguttaceae bacterium]|jgi:hypothetical protein|nr:DUF1016 N-terminal domain-containing protein [Thermoguttaceae bacterium]
MNERLPTPPGFADLYERVRAILSDARARAYRAINTAMVTAYWEIGRVIVEDEQQGRQRAEYGKGLLAELSKRLTADFGRGFDRTNLQQMRAFYTAYPICDALRPELTWTHYRLLLRVESPDARAFYEAEASTPDTSSICRRKRNWLRNCNASDELSKWKATCEKSRVLTHGKSDVRVRRDVPTPPPITEPPS